MAGGRFEVALVATEAPQSFGLESAEFLVAGHAGSTPRPLAKVASGGELSRIALPVAVVDERAASAGAEAPATLIFDEIDAGVGGAVAETVGRLMKQLGRDRQVLAVTHLPQVAACADHHFVVSKQRARRHDDAAPSTPVAGEARVAEIARMLGGEKLSSTSLAHAQEMLAVRRRAARARPQGARAPTTSDPDGVGPSLSEGGARRREQPCPATAGDARTRPRAKSCWSPASPARANRSRCTRSRTPASSASTTCRPSCCATSCASRRSAATAASRSPSTCAAPARCRTCCRCSRSCTAKASACSRSSSTRRTDALVRRFSETRRAPIRSADRGALVEAIELERELLAEPARGLDRDRHQPAAPDPAAQLDARARRRRRQPADAGVRELRLSSTACRSTPTTCSTCACCPTRTTCASCAR